MTRASAPDDSDYSTIEVAQRLGMAVRSVQLMVDRGELDAWKTPGGHRRISRASVERWLLGRRSGRATAVAASTGASSVAAHSAPAPSAAPAPAPAPSRRAAAPDPSRRVLVIEDSKHYQNLLQLVLKQFDPRLEVHVADDGIAGLAMAGSLQPRLLIVDILLPGIDGGTLIMGLRSHPQFAASRLIVVTSLEGAELEPYRFALEGVVVVPKARLLHEMPARLREALGEAVRAVA